MWIKFKAAAVGSIAVILATTTACGNNNAIQNKSIPTPTPSPSINQGNTGSNLTHGLSQHGQDMKMLSGDNAVIPINSIGNVKYVSANELTKVLGFQSAWENGNQKMLIGDYDANFELFMNSNKAIKEGKEIKVGQPFIKQGDTAYIPVSALADLFKEDMSYEVQDNQLLIHPSSIITVEHEEDLDPRSSAAELNFGEDPADPFKGEVSAASPASIGSPSNADLEVWASNGDEEVIPVFKNIDMNALILKGKQYLGVPYLFGSSSYPQTGKFDCSTFTQYVYGKYGIKLPRLAREQAALGTLVSRNSLRKGDLLFFFVPGRFKTNTTVGHVGIYIGNMQMLNASPEPLNGVQITSINKPHWKQTFLFAKRVAL